jgi:Mn2+/Fe2+ NRAMP family transporter
MIAGTEATGSAKAARAVGRCYGALFFSVFGGAWILLAAYAFGRLNKLGACLIAAAVVLFVVSAMRLQGRGRDAGKDAFPEGERRRNDRIFGIVNSVT